MHWERKIELLTPTFCRGGYQDSPELRAPSIRGMVRWWFRALGGSPDEEKLAFGGLKGFGQAFREEVRASQLVLRVSEQQTQRANPVPGTLPHKSGGQGNPQAAFAAGGSFRLEVFSRFGELPQPIVEKTMRALEVWLLLGSLGLRANRGGGSIWPSAGGPESPEHLRARVDALGCRWPVYLAGTEFGTSGDALRAAATDTVSEPAWVFGTISRGERLSSPLKMKVIRLGQVLRLLITAPDERIILEAQKALRGHRSKPEGWKKLPN